MQRPSYLEIVGPAIGLDKGNFAFLASFTLSMFTTQHAVIPFPVDVSEHVLIINLSGSGFSSPGIVTNMKRGDFPPCPVDVGDNIALGDLLMVHVVDDLAAGMIDTLTDHIRLRNPVEELARMISLQNVEVLLVATANMDPWGSQQDVYVKARAMENQIFLALANRIGRENDLVFCGSSAVVDPMGRILAGAGRRDPALLIADIDLADVEKTRSSGANYLADRRPEVYRPLADTK